MDPANRERLRKNHILLKEGLQILPVLDRMYQEGVVTPDEDERIRCQPTTQDKCQMFLEHLRTKGNEDYTTFCKVLEDLQPALLKTIEDTVIDRETLGEAASSNIFFDPSDDFELKGLVDELTKDNAITGEQLERMKSFVIDEPGCAEEIIETIQTPGKLLRHLMRTRLMTRYNLTFLQALLWRVGNKDLCLQVARFARTCCQKPVYFYSPPKEAENGYAFGKFHIEGQVDHFKGITIEDICNRVSRYLGIPLSHVVPMGVEPSTSILLTIMIPLGAMETLKSVVNWSWLADLGIDYIEHDGGKIVLKEFHEDTPSQNQIIEAQLKRRIELEQHLKQCLYAEQVSNENLKDIQAELEERLRISEETTVELNRWYMRIFAVLLISFHFIAELIKQKRGLLVRRSPSIQELYNQRFSEALQKAKRWTLNHQSLMQLVDATKEMEHNKDRIEIENLRNITNASLAAMQQNLNEAVTTRMTERRLGVFKEMPSLDVMQQEFITLSVLFGLLRLEPMFEEILVDLVKRLDKDELQNICRKFDVPIGLQTEKLKPKIILYIIFSELDKQGKQETSIENMDAIVKDCFREAGRKDLWEEYESMVRSQMIQQQVERDAQSEKERDITDRLDKMEKMLQTVVGQTMLGNMGMRHGNGATGSSSSFADPYGERFKNLKFQLQNYPQDTR